MSSYFGKIGGRRRARQPKLLLRGFWFLYVAVSIGLIFAIQHYVALNERASLRANATESLAVQIVSLEGVLEKYRLLPSVLATRSDLLQLAAAQPSALNVEEASRKLGEVATLSGAADLVIFNTRDQIVGTARGLLPRSVMDIRAFRDALAQRRLARMRVLLNSGENGYVFATQLRREGQRVGALAVVVPFATIDRAWSLSRDPILVTERDERVFLANRAEWVGKTWFVAGDNQQGLVRYSKNDRAMLTDPDGALHIEAVQNMPLLNWNLHVLVPAHSIAALRWQYGVIAALILMALGTAGVLAQRNMAIRNAAARNERANALRLERRVRDRTRELKSTQMELIHAAKLATIGQMSAAVSHEFNQPLGAIRTFADNAIAFLERNAPAKAEGNMRRVVDLVDRMSRLSKMLLSFSRKPGTELKQQAIKPIVDEAIWLVMARAEKEGIALINGVDDAIVALTGRTRLGQVLVNLINNAIDAHLDHRSKKAVDDNPYVRIEAVSDSQYTQIAVSDNGPGLSATALAEVFTPFFTTRSDGHGLGLSIVENILSDLDGTISVANNEQAGACFTIVLPAITKMEPRETDPNLETSND